MTKQILFNVCQAFMCLILVSPMEAQSIREPGIKSPEVNEDNSITFHLLAPEAKNVTITGSWMSGRDPKAEMVKNDTVWSFTTNRLEPDFFTYSFNMDGVRIIDPLNSFAIRAGNQYRSAIILPGEESKVYSVQDVPRGTLSKVWYDSPSLDMRRRMYVYTPAGYGESNKKYPVFYLLHGAGGDENSWTALGRAPYILDNLIASEKAVPMIVVMTNGNPWDAASPNEATEIKKLAKPDVSEMAKGKFEKSLVSDVVPYIESHYNVLTDKKHRAIAGLSMGGFHTQNITNRNPGMFEYIGVMSMGLLMDNPRFGINYNKEEHKKQIKSIQDSGVKLYWIACGEEDFLFESVTKLRGFYDEIGFNYEYRESNGGHTWANWRLYLSEFAPKLFK